MGRVALVGENSVEYVNILLDIWNSGDCAVLLDWRIPFNTLIEMMREAEVYKCYVEENLFVVAETILPSTIVFITYQKKHTTAVVLPQCVADKFHDNYSNEEAVIIYSSGTTGKSKGVVLSHFAINTNADAIIDYMKPTFADCIYVVKALSHSSTLTGELLIALKKNIDIVLGPTIVLPRLVFDNIKKMGVTIICLNPTLLSMFVDEYAKGNYDLKSLRKIYVSGSILSDVIYYKARSNFEGVTIYNVYGLSEAGPRVAAQTDDCCTNNSVGKPIRGVDVVIVNEKGIRVPNGEHGVIYVNTPSAFNSYVVEGNIRKNLYGNWINTGDIGYFDSAGELHIVARLDDVMIINAHKVYPGELEKVIQKCMGIKECAVAKIDIQGDEFIGCLYVGEKQECMEIKKRLKKFLPLYEIPRVFYSCDSIPKTNNGKASVKMVRDCLNKYMKGDSCER